MSLDMRFIQVGGLVYPCMLENLAQESAGGAPVKVGRCEFFVFAYCVARGYHRLQHRLLTHRKMPPTPHYTRERLSRFVHSYLENTCFKTLWRGTGQGGLVGRILLRRHILVRCMRSSYVYADECSTSNINSTSIL